MLDPSKDVYNNEEHFSGVYVNGVSTGSRYGHYMTLWLTTLSYPNVKISTVMLLYWFDWRENQWPPGKHYSLPLLPTPCWWPYLGVVKPAWTRQPARLTTCSCPSRNERLGIVWVNSRGSISNSPIPHLSTAGLGAAEITGFKVRIGI